MDIDQEVKERLPWEEYQEMVGDDIEIESKFWEVYTEEDKESLEILAEMTNSKIVVLKPWIAEKRTRNQ